MLCDYGCGNSAIKQFKNGKWCCSEDYHECPQYKKKISKALIGHIGSRKGETKETNEWLMFLSKKLTGRKLPKEVCDKISKSNKGKKISEESRMKQSLSISGKNNYLYGRHRSEEVKKKISETLKIKCKGKTPTKKCIEASREINRQRLLNGGAVYMNKCIKNPSKPEVMLRNIIKELYPNCEFQYKVFNYSLDVAIPELMIAIEYDGWYHFDCQENIEYHKQRQHKIEELGWKFIRYDIFNKFPEKEKIIKDLNNIKGVGNEPEGL